MDYYADRFFSRSQFERGIARLNARVEYGRGRSSKMTIVYDYNGDVTVRVEVHRLAVGKQGVFFTHDGYNAVRIKYGGLHTYGRGSRGQYRAIYTALWAAFVEVKIPTELYACGVGL